MNRTLQRRSAERARVSSTHFTHFTNRCDTLMVLGLLQHFGYEVWPTWFTWYKIHLDLNMSLLPKITLARKIGSSIGYRQLSHEIYSTNVDFMPLTNAWNLFVKLRQLHYASTRYLSRILSIVPCFSLSPFENALFMEPVNGALLPADDRVKILASPHDVDRITHSCIPQCACDSGSRGSGGDCLLWSGWHSIFV